MTRESGSVATIRPLLRSLSSASDHEQAKKPRARSRRAAQQRAAAQPPVRAPPPRRRPRLGAARAAGRSARPRPLSSRASTCARRRSRSSRSRSARRASFSRSSCGRLPATAAGETRYEIVAGERRWRAAQIAGLHTIPAVIRDIPDEAAVAVALIENIQRENLNPIEEARALQRLVEEFGLTHARRGGRRRSLARDRDQPAAAARAAEGGARDARAPRARHGPRARAARVRVGRAAARDRAARVAERLERARDRERGAQRRGSARPAKAAKRGGSGTATRTSSRLEAEPRRNAGRGRHIEHGAKGGRVVIRYHGLDELEGILAHIK